MVHVAALPRYIPSPPINSFHVGPLNVHFYALGYIIGITAAILITRRRWRAVGGDPDVVNDLALWVVPAGIIGGLEVEAFDLVIGTAALDCRPFDDRSATGDGVAHVGLLEDLFETGAGAAIGEELFPGKIGSARAIDEFDEAQLNSVNDGDAVVEIPRICD